MDFARIDTRKDAEAGATLHLWNPYEPGELLYADGEPIEIDFVGPDSDHGRAAAARMFKTLNSRGKKITGKKTGAGARKKPSDLSVEDLTVEDILAAGDADAEAKAEYYADLATGWRNISYIEDADLDDPEAKAQPLEFSHENAVKLFRTRRWIREEADDFLAEKLNFMRRYEPT